MSDQLISPLRDYNIDLDGIITDVVVNSTQLQGNVRLQNALEPTKSTDVAKTLVYKVLEQVYQKLQAQMEVTSNDTQ